LCPTLTSRAGTGGGNLPLVGIEQPPIAVRTDQTGSNGLGVNETGVAHTLDQANGQAVAFAQNTRDEVRLVNGDGQISGALAANPGMKQTSYVAIPQQLQSTPWDLQEKRIRDIREGVAPTLAGCDGGGGRTCAGFFAMPENETIAFNGDQSAKTRSMGESKECSPTLRADGPCHVAQVQWASGGGQVENDTAQCLRSNAEHNYQFVRNRMQVRRLTPVECERLQGFPDGYTKISWRGKPAEECPDGPRYKALGNSWAVNCARWIGRRIEMVEQIIKSSLEKEHEPGCAHERVHQQEGG